MDDALDAPGDGARVDHEEARVEPPHPAGRRDRARKKVDARRAPDRRRPRRSGPRRPAADSPARRNRGRRPQGRSPRKSRESRRARSPARTPAKGAGTRRFSFSSTIGSSAPATAIRRSSGSTRPPGKTNLPGMNLWPPCRLPISTFGSGPSRSRMISVAASRGRSARSPAAECASVAKRRFARSRSHPRLRGPASAPRPRTCNRIEMGQQ